MSGLYICKQLENIKRRGLFHETYYFYKIQISMSITEVLLAPSHAPWPVSPMVAFRLQMPRAPASNWVRPDTEQTLWDRPHQSFANRHVWSSLFVSSDGLSYRLLPAGVSLCSDNSENVTRCSHPRDPHVPPSEGPIPTVVFRNYL